MKLKQTEKKNVIESLLNVPKVNKRGFWAREIKLLNDLFMQYPSLDFWRKLNFPDRYDSLSFFKSQFGMEKLKKKFSEYNYVPKQTLEIKIYDNKFGKPYKKNKKQKTIKSFLTDE